MKKININFLIISLILGIILGAISEFALILDIKWLIDITQTFTFWGIIMLVVPLCSKEYVNSILASSIIMTAMSATYYLIRFFKSGYTNIGSWQMFTILGIAGSIYISTCVYCIKQKIINKKINDYIPKFSLFLMTIFSIILTIIHIQGIKNNVLIFGFYTYNPSIIGIIIGLILGVILGKYFNQKK